MPKRIACLIAGLERSYQREVVDGMCKRAKELNYNLFIFHTQGGMDFDVHTNMEGEANIYRLPDPTALDGAILLVSTLSNPIAVKNFNEFAQRACDLPLVSVCCEMENAYYLDYEDAVSLREITEHFIKEHGAKRICYVSGPKENAVARKRLEAIRKTLKEHDLPFDDKQIFYGNFLLDGGRRAAQYFTRNGEPLPDAIICANDNTAIGLYEELDKLGIRVPEQLGISGFDCTEEALVHYPMITTIRRSTETIGSMAVDVLHNAFWNRPVEHSQVLETKVVYGQSCGCNKDMTDVQKPFIDHLLASKRELSNDFFKASYFYNIFSGVSSFVQFRERFLPYVEESQYEELYVLIDETLFMPSATQPGAPAMPPPTQDATGYPPTMKMVFGYNRGTLYGETTFSTSRLLPQIIGTELSARQLVFCPLHYQEKCFGYVAFDPAHANDFSLHTLMVNLGAAMENMSLHMTISAYADALEKMYIRDSLTGLLNRRGYMQYAAKLYEQAIQRAQPLMVLCADLDHLKRINDTYGHHEGDEAIKAMAAALDSVTPASDVCIHLSGDEFMVIGLNYSKARMEEFIHSIQEEIDRFNTISGKPYQVKASIGGHTQIPAPDSSLEQLTSIADDAMYTVKKQHHAQFG